MDARGPQPTNRVYWINFEIIPNKLNRDVVNFGQVKGSEIPLVESPGWESVIPRLGIRQSEIIKQVHDRN